ncbi:ATPase [Prolixibacteraceae bacterium JC049]|nr:ATPase [Prolixibacteraceae bacterium JC049]
MILIAESGSTKTDWVLLDNGKLVDQQQSAGINPFFQSVEAISDTISFLKEFKHIESIFFYGAGCANEEKNQIIQQAFATIFPHTNCSVASDLLAAARALCGNQQGIACIMGTGSNSCFYDGENITQNVSPLGFILGDEGSGAVLGKKIMADILKNQASKEIIEAFWKAYDFQPHDIINKVYREPFPNRFLAKFTRFLKEHIENPYIETLIVNSFCEFIERNIKQYPNFQNETIHFTGSIAFHFLDQLKQVAAQFNLKIGNVLQSPLQGLIDYHSKTSNHGK